MTHRFWRFRLSIIKIVDNEDYAKNAYPLYYFKFPKLVKKIGRISLDWMVIFSHGVSLTFFTDKSIMKRWYIRKV